VKNSSASMLRFSDDVDATTSSRYWGLGCWVWRCRCLKQTINTKQ